MGNFQGVVFIWTQTYMGIFKSALVHLQESEISGYCFNMNTSIYREIFTSALVYPFVGLLILIDGIEKFFITFFYNEKFIYIIQVSYWFCLSDSRYETFGVWLNLLVSVIFFLLKFIALFLGTIPNETIFNCLYFNWSRTYRVN